MRCTTGRSDCAGGDLAFGLLRTHSQRLLFLLKGARVTAQDTYLAFMMDYVAGNQAPAFSLAGDLHVCLNNNGAETSFLWTVIGGVLLESVAIDDVGGEPCRGVPQRADDLCKEDVISMVENPLKWRRNIFGVQSVPLGLKGARLMRLSPGTATPRHGHHGLEVTVVLQGCLDDGNGVYRRGDLAIGEPGMTHKPEAVGNEACICFVAEEPRWKWWPF